jgi:LysM repeat protein
VPLYLAADPNTDILTTPGDTLRRADGSVVGELLPGQVVYLVPDGFHVVKAGETFWSLSRRYATSVTALQKMNPTVDPRKMPVGTMLRIK